MKARSIYLYVLFITTIVFCSCKNEQSENEYYYLAFIGESFDIRGNITSCTETSFDYDPFENKIHKVDSKMLFSDELVELQTNITYGEFETQQTLDIQLNFLNEDEFLLTVDGNVQFLDKELNITGEISGSEDGENASGNGSIKITYGDTLFSSIKISLNASKRVEIEKVLDQDEIISQSESITYHNPNNDSTAIYTYTNDYADKIESYSAEVEIFNNKSLLEEKIFYREDEMILKFKYHSYAFDSKNNWISRSIDIENYDDHIATSLSGTTLNETREIKYESWIRPYVNWTNFIFYCIFGLTFFIVITKGILPGPDFEFDGVYPVKIFDWARSEEVTVGNLLSMIILSPIWPIVGFGLIFGVLMLIWKWAIDTWNELMSKKLF